MPTATGQAIREELLEWGITLMLGAATATAGGTNRIRDTIRLAGSALASTMYDDCWVRVTSGTGVDEISKVDYLDMDAGDLYVSPVFSGSVTSGATYEIYRPGVFPDDLDRARDEALTRYCSQWAVQPVSEIPNADYEDGVTSWTATDSTRTVASGVFPYEVWRSSILVTNSAANGRIASDSLYRRIGQKFYLYVPVSVRSGTATVIVRDVTGSTNIALTGTSTSTGRGWTGIEVTGEIPTGGGEIQVWLRGDEATAIVEWGPVNFHMQGQMRIQLPARVDSYKHVGRIYRAENFAQRGVNDEWGVEDLIDVPAVRRVPVNDAVMLRFPTPLRDQPYFFQERIFYDALSADYLTVAQRTTGDAATTLCPIDYVAAGTARVLAEWYMIKQPGEAQFWSSVGQSAQAWLDVWERRHGPRPEPIATRERTLSIPQLRV